MFEKVCTILDQYWLFQTDLWNHLTPLCYRLGSTHDTPHRRLKWDVRLKVCWQCGKINGGCLCFKHPLRFWALWSRINIWRSCTNTTHGDGYTARERYILRRLAPGAFSNDIHNNQYRWIWKSNFFITILWPIHKTIIYDVNIKSGSQNSRSQNSHNKSQSSFIHVCDIWSIGVIYKWWEDFRGMNE